MSLPKESITGAWKDAPPIIPIKDKATYEKWAVSFIAWVEAFGAASTILATYNLADKQLGKIFVSRFKDQSPDYIMTVPITGYLVGEENHDVAGLAQREQTLSSLIQEAAIRAGVEAKFENLLLSSSTTKKKKATLPDNEQKAKTQIQEQFEKLKKEGSPAKEASTTTTTTTTTTGTSSAFSTPSQRPKLSGADTKSALPTPPVRATSMAQTTTTAAVQEMSKEFLDILGLTSLDKKVLSTKAPLWLDVATWTREKSSSMSARIAIWNYMIKSLLGTPYAHILNSVEVYDVRGLYSKMKGLLNQCTLMTLSMTVISLFKLMGECPVTKDPAVYYGELMEKSTLVEEMARQVDMNPATSNATNGFKVPPFLLTVAVINALSTRKDMQGLVQDLLRRGDLGNTIITPEEIIKQAQQYQANVRAINPKMGALSQFHESFESMSAEDPKPDRCHRNYNGVWCDEARCRFKHYKPNVEKPNPERGSAPNQSSCSGCGKDKQNCPSRNTCAAKDNVCGHCQIKGHFKANCKKQADGVPATPPSHKEAATTSSGRGKSTRGRGRGGKSRGGAHVTFHDSSSEPPPDFNTYDEGEDVDSAFHSLHAQSMYGTSPSSIASRPKSAANGVRFGEAKNPGPPKKSKGSRAKRKKSASPPLTGTGFQATSTNDSNISDSATSSTSTTFPTPVDPITADPNNPLFVAQALRDSRTNLEKTMQEMKQGVGEQYRELYLQREALDAINRRNNAVAPRVREEDMTRLQRVRIAQGQPCSNPTCARYGNYQCGNCASRYCSKSCQIKEAKNHRSVCFTVPDLTPVIPDQEEAEGRGDTLGLETPRLFMVPPPDQRHPQDVIALPYLEMYSGNQVHQNMTKIMNLLSPTADPSMIHVQRMHFAGLFLCPLEPVEVKYGQAPKIFLDSTHLDETRAYFSLLSKSRLFELAEIYGPWGKSIFDQLHTIFEIYSESDHWQLEKALFTYLTSMEMYEKVSMPAVRAPLNSRIIDNTRDLCTWPYLKSVSIHALIRYHAKDINHIAGQEIANSGSVHPGTFFLCFIFRDFPIIHKCLQKISRDEMKDNNFECHKVLLDKLADYSRDKSVNLLCLSYPEELYRDIHLKLEVWGNCEVKDLNKIFDEHDSYVSATLDFEKIARSLYYGRNKLRADPDIIARPAAVVYPRPSEFRSTAQAKRVIPKVVRDTQNSLVKISEYTLAISGDPDLVPAIVGQFYRDRGSLYKPGPDLLNESVEGVLSALGALQKTLFGFDQLTAYNFDPEGSTPLDQGDEVEPDTWIRYGRNTLRINLLKEKETGETFNRAINGGVVIDRRFQSFRIGDELDVRPLSAHGKWVQGVVDAVAKDEIMVLHKKKDNQSMPYWRDPESQFSWFSMTSENIAPLGTRTPYYSGMIDPRNAQIAGTRITSDAEMARQVARKDAPQPVLPRLPRHIFSPYTESFSPTHSPTPRHLEADIADDFSLESMPEEFRQNCWIPEEKKTTHDVSVQTANVSTTAPGTALESLQERTLRSTNQN